MSLIRLLVFQNGGTAEDACDIFQDSLIIILEKIDEGNFVLKCKFKTFLYSVCENLWRTILDKRRAAANYMSATADQHHTEKDISDELDRELHEEIFREVFETMDQVSKNILNLYWQDVSGLEIAEKLGLTHGYVRKRKCEAQNELISRIKQHPGYIKIMNSDKTANGIVK
jgi:RNA polymerase sigma factor (sigma-70 family)